MAGAGDEVAAAEGGRGRLRASHDDREQVIASLKSAFVQGRLTKDELDSRVGQTLEALTHADLAPLTADLPAGFVAAHPPREASPPQAAKNMRTFVRVTITAAGVLAVLVLARLDGWPGAIAWFAFMLAGATMVAAATGTVVLMVDSRRQVRRGRQLRSVGRGA
jgi:uncharacterized protein DUF1707